MPGNTKAQHWLLPTKQNQPGEQPQCTLGHAGTRGTAGRDISVGWVVPGGVLDGAPPYRRWVPGVLCGVYSLLFLLCGLPGFLSAASLRKPSSALVGNTEVNTEEKHGSQH